jgi:hypothetical protein
MKAYLEEIEKRDVLRTRVRERLADLVAAERVLRPLMTSQAVPAVAFDYQDNAIAAVGPLVREAERVDRELADSRNEIEQLRSTHKQALAAQKKREKEAREAEAREAKEAEAREAYERRKAADRRQRAMEAEARELLIKLEEENKKREMTRRKELEEEEKRKQRRKIYSFVMICGGLFLLIEFIGHYFVWAN